MKKISLMLLGLLSVSCVNNDYNFRGYVAAHRLSYEADVLLNQKVIQDNPAISPEDKATFKRRLDTELNMITEAEKLLNGGVVR